MVLSDMRNGIVYTAKPTRRAADVRGNRAAVESGAHRARSISMAMAYSTSSSATRGGSAIRSRSRRCCGASRA